MRDSEGRSFTAACSREGMCKLGQAAGPKRGELPAQVLSGGGRLVGICDVTEGAAPAAAFDCRPLRCATDQDCPPAHGMRDGQCLNHWCADPAGAINVDDSVMLCLSGTGLGRQSPSQIERYALALNCGTPCVVPKPCAQP